MYGQSTGSLVARRRISQTLPKLKIPQFEVDDDNYNCTSPTEKDIEDEAKELFEHFIVDQIRKEGLNAPIECLSFASTPKGYQNPMWAKAGRELRLMADEFAKTKERDSIKDKAEQVGIGEVTYEQFRDFLTELFFEGTVTRERIMVLFFFCSDVAIRSLSFGNECFQKFFCWSVQFITRHVCSWVRQHGGWGAVLSSSFHCLPKVILVLGMAFIVGVGISKLWNRP